MISSRVRSAHLDPLSIISEVIPSGAKSSTSKRGFAHSFSYRTHLSWNRLPLSLREIVLPSEFKSKLIQIIWNQFVITTSESESEGE